MEVRIGVTYAPRELELELGDDADRDKVLANIEATVGKGDGMLWLTDRKGRTVGVPAAKVAYVEVGSPKDDRRVGFGVT